MMLYEFKEAENNRIICEDNYGKRAIEGRQGVIS
jgi:hypothetical protein